MPAYYFNQVNLITFLNILILYSVLFNNEEHNNFICIIELNSVEQSFIIVFGKRGVL